MELALEVFKDSTLAGVVLGGVLTLFRGRG